MPRKIKILHIIKSLGRGGAEMLLPETLKIHNKDKFEFHYIYFLPWKNQMVSEIEDAGGHVTCLDANNNIQLIRRVSAVKVYILKYEIDIIHAHLPWAGFLSRIIFKSLKIPVLYTEHNKQERYHKVTYYINRWTFNSQSIGIAVSADVCESIHKNISPDIPVKTILNGVNTDYFMRDREAGFKIAEQAGIPESAIVVGTVAVFRFQKRLKEWLQVFAKAAQGNPNLYGVIVGDGPLKNEIEDERRRLGLVSRVIMPGLQTNTREWFSSMDIFMMTSVFEGLPIALLEAMSMQCAILTTDAGGIKEVIRENEDGLIVGVKDWQNLSGKLSTLVNDKSAIEDLGNKARKRVIGEFSMKRMVRELEEIYAQTAGGHP